jgi:two-component system, NarL family, nitrate/nitrite response regulator NarL
MAPRPQLAASPPTYPLRVCALSADALAAEAVRAALSEDPRLECVAEPAQADVLLWDAGAEQTGSLPTELQTSQPWIALVAREELAPFMLAHGARGVLQRRAHALSLAAAVVAVRLGLCVLDLAVAEPCLRTPDSDAPLPRVTGPTGDAAGYMEAVDALTQREHEVLAALALGLSNRVIAERLGVSVHTVKFHVNSILAKLQVDTRAGAVAKALRRGVLRT